MLKKGDTVVMHTCIEAEEHNGKIWTCKSNEFKRRFGNSVFLEGFSGGFDTKYLQLVKVEGLIAELQKENERLSKLVEGVVEGERD